MLNWLFKTFLIFPTIRRFVSFFPQNPAFCAIFFPSKKARPFPQNQIKTPEVGTTAPTRNINKIDKHLVPVSHVRCCHVSHKSHVMACWRGETIRSHEIHNSSAIRTSRNINSRMTLPWPRCFLYTLSANILRSKDANWLKVYKNNITPL